MPKTPYPTARRGREALWESGSVLSTQTNRLCLTHSLCAMLHGSEHRVAVSSASLYEHRVATVSSASLLVAWLLQMNALVKIVT